MTIWICNDAVKLTFLLKQRKMIHIVPTIVNRITDSIRLVVLTLKVLFLARLYIALITQGSPRPRNTFTLLEPAKVKHNISNYFKGNKSKYDNNIQGYLLFSRSSKNIVWFNPPKNGYLSFQIIESFFI